MAEFHCTSSYFLTGGIQITDGTTVNTKGQTQSFMLSKINEAMNGSGADNLENLYVEITKVV